MAGSRLLKPSLPSRMAAPRPFFFIRASYYLHRRRLEYVDLEELRRTEQPEPPHRGGTDGGRGRIVRDRAGEEAVHLLRERTVLVAGPQSGFHVSHGDVPVVGGDRCGDDVAVAGPGGRGQTRAGDRQRAGAHRDQAGVPACESQRRCGYVAGRSRRASAFADGEIVVRVGAQVLRAAAVIGHRATRWRQLAVIVDVAADRQCRPSNVVENLG